MSGLYRVSVHGTMVNQQIVNVFGWQGKNQAGSDSLADAQTAAQVVTDAFATNFLPILASEYAIQGGTARAVRTQGILAEYPKVAAGAQGAGSLPSFVAQRMIWTTAVQGRHGKGRTGLAGVPKTQIGVGAPNQIVQGSMAGFQAAIDAFLAACNTAVGQLAIISTTKGVGGAPSTYSSANVLTGKAVASLGSRLSRLR